MEFRDRNVRLSDIASFIAKLNQQKSHHIGYIGDQEEEIKDWIMSEFPSEDEMGRSFTLAYENGQLAGVLGFNADLHKGNAEIWGPFVLESHEDFWTVSKQLWDIGVQKLGGEISEFRGFYNRENTRGRRFIERLGANKINSQIIMNKKKPNAAHTKTLDGVQEITPEYYSEFIQLHDKSFLNTYYTGKEILDLLNENNKLFVCIKQECLAGYCYISGNPAFQEGNIEFIAVPDEFRKQGIGKDLLCKGLDFLFFDLYVEEITMCVDFSNQGAIRLYESVGFNKEDVLDYYKVKI